MGSSQHLFLHKLYFCLSFTVSFCVALPGSAEAPTYAERMGWPVGARVVIFHIDDAGMSHDSNIGTIEAIENGTATSFSIMMPCPWVPEIASYCREHPEVDAGVHLTLTSEWKKYRWGPVAGKTVVPGLVDEAGYLWRKVFQVMEHASADEVETELRAQIDKALAMGLKPTHLDTHMGTVMQPMFIERYVKVGMEYRIPVMIFGGHMQHIGEEIGLIKPLMRRFAENVWAAGLPVLDDLVTEPVHGKEYEVCKSELIGILKGMQPGLTQIILHCTQPSAGFASISSSGGGRQRELRLMLDEDVRALIEEEGIILTTWRELMTRRDRALPVQSEAPSNTRPQSLQMPGEM